MHVMNHRVIYILREINLNIRHFAHMEILPTEIDHKLTIDSAVHLYFAPP